MRRWIAIAALLCAALGAAWAQSGGVSAPDPYITNPNLFLMGHPLVTASYTYNYNGLTPVSPLLPGCSNTGTGIFIGTSTSDNVTNALYTPTNPTKIFTLSIDNGGVYVAKEPLIGGYGSAATSPTTPAANGNFITELADTLVSNGVYDCFVAEVLGTNNAAMADWASGGQLFSRIRVSYKRAGAIGLSVKFFAIQVGENDTVAGTSQASFTASLTSVINEIRAAGFAGTILVSSTSYTGGTTSSNVTNAQAAAINNGSGIYAGPNTDSLNSANRWDNTHWNAAGESNLSGLWLTAISAAPH